MYKFFCTVHITISFKGQHFNLSIIWALLFLPDDDRLLHIDDGVKLNVVKLKGDEGTKADDDDVFETAKVENSPLMLKSFCRQNSSMLVFSPSPPKLTSPTLSPPTKLESPRFENVSYG